MSCVYLYLFYTHSSLWRNLEIMKHWRAKQSGKHILSVAPLTQSVHPKGQHWIQHKLEKLQSPFSKKKNVVVKWETILSWLGHIDYWLFWLFPYHHKKILLYWAPGYYSFCKFPLFFIESLSPRWKLWLWK